MHRPFPPPLSDNLFRRLIPGGVQGIGVYFLIPENYREIQENLPRRTQRGKKNVNADVLGGVFSRLFRLKGPG
jgi:hypothetical protein